jgi:hypothetical protein
VKVASLGPAHELDGIGPLRVALVALPPTVGVDVEAIGAAALRARPGQLALCPALEVRRISSSELGQVDGALQGLRVQVGSFGCVHGWHPILRIEAVTE